MARHSDATRVTCPRAATRWSSSPARPPAAAKAGHGIRGEQVSRGGHDPTADPRRIPPPHGVGVQDGPHQRVDVPRRDGGTGRVQGGQVELEVVGGVDRHDPASHAQRQHEVQPGHRIGLHAPPGLQRGHRRGVPDAVGDQDRRGPAHPRVRVVEQGQQPRPCGLQRGVPRRVDEVGVDGDGLFRQEADQPDHLGPEPGERVDRETGEQGQRGRRRRAHPAALVVEPVGEVEEGGQRDVLVRVPAVAHEVRHVGGVAVVVLQLGPDDLVLHAGNPRRSGSGTSSARHHRGRVRR
ncbi:hypothetical protein [Umezawaea sp. NPDC059074]|uniref:hypothetical protein n=1 Tax=Umezawaea sp. NPDC059074 TaxID=3346716 RepID=UPI0036B95645